MRLLSIALLLVCLPAVAQEKTGAEVYASTCMECHGGGKHNAPLFGNKKHWGNWSAKVLMIWCRPPCAASAKCRPRAVTPN
jgi:hypothetical protein